MSTCQACQCTNTTGRTTKGKSFFEIPEPKNAKEQKRMQQWLHNNTVAATNRFFI